MEEALLSYLLANPGLAALAFGRVSWGWREQGSAVPAVTLVHTDGPRDVALDGYTGFVDGHAQADCWGDTQMSSTLLARALVAALGGVNQASTGGVIQGAFVEHEEATFEGERPDRLFRTRLALRLPYNEV